MMNASTLPVVVSTVPTLVVVMIGVLTCPSRYLHLANTCHARPGSAGEHPAGAQEEGMETISFMG